MTHSKNGISNDGDYLISTRTKTSAAKGVKMTFNYTGLCVSKENDLKKSFKQVNLHSILSYACKVCIKVYFRSCKIRLIRK